jgi:tetratricopeptide (TPR) repeat protein
MWLGSAEAHLGNKTAAEQDLVAAVELADPKKRDAVLPYVELASTLASEGRTQDAQQKLEEARKKLPDSAALERSFGMVAEVEGRLDEAVARYREALAKDPRDVATRFHLGVALRRMRRFDDAASELDKVQASDKDFPGLALERGLLYEESGDVEKAIEQFKAALAKAPDDPDLQLRVGSAYVMINRPDDALPMLKSVLNQRPNSAEAHHYIGRAYFEKGSLNDALRFLKRAVDLDPNRAEFHIYVAWVSVESMPPKLDVAKEETDKALAIDKMLPEGYWIRGKLECEEGAVVDGEKDLKRALSMRPSRIEAHAGLAECYEQQSDYANEMAEWAKAVAGDSTRPYWRYRYGKMLLDKGQSGAALGHLAFAVSEGEKIEGGRPAWLAPAEFAAATAYRKAGKKADAVDHYKRFIDLAPAGSPDLAEARKEFAALGGGDR